MPFHTRAARSLLALALIASLVAAGAPSAALGRQPLLAGVDRTPASAPQPGPDARQAASPAPMVRRAIDERTTSVQVPAAPRETSTATRVAWVTRATPDVPAPKPKSVSKAELKAGGSGTSGPSSYKGRNHVWIPALGINRSVSFFSCTSSAYPGDRVYRWGCAGSNNVYLFGHAHSVFRPLHDAYVRGRLSKGMKVVYADGNGRVSTYAVSWWKVTTPDKGAFAYAAQSRPSLTLQTCVGANSQYRLIVRLHKVG
jgi:sortase (surface protein transpeptidase)